MTAQPACRTTDLAPEEALRVELTGANGVVEVAIVRDADGEYHALSDVCSHGAVSLSAGDVDGCEIECYLHGSTFDLRTGAPTCLPATRPVPVYPVTVDGEVVLVDVDATV